MKIAALVLTYRYPLGVSALARFCDEAGIDMFVHVDTKTDIAPFMSAAPRVRFVEDRVGVYWRGFTMIEATINLIEAAKAHADRYILLSDDSLPLVSPGVLRERLAIGDYISAAPINDGMRLRYERFLMFDSPATQVRWQHVVDREVTEDALDRLARLGALRKYGKKPINAVYYGSQWMALTGASVEKIMDSWSNNIWLRQSFEFSDVPDESYFQTILSQDQPEWRRLMHVDWSGDRPPRVFKTLSEISTVNPQGALFLRKIDLTAADLDRWMERLLEPLALPSSA
jgi:Core-2/I-Branching enzyme